MMRILGQTVWCPSCNQYVKLLKVPDAARLIDVDRRTIYRYIEQGSVFSVKTAGDRYRLCGSCLVKQEPDK